MSDGGRRRRSTSREKYRRFQGERLSATATTATAVMSCRRNWSFMDFRCRQTGASDESNPDTHTHHARRVLFKGATDVAFYRADTRHAETFTDLRMREATVAIEPLPPPFAFTFPRPARTIATDNRHVNFLIEMRAA